MEQFNRKTYKKQTALEEFRHSCLGKIVILLVLFVVLLLIAMVTRPTDSMMQWQTEDNIRECLQASDSIQSDIIDDYVGNVGRVFTHADPMKTDTAQWNTFLRHNRLVVYQHLGYKTAYIYNNVHPQGVRVGIGLFGIVFPTVKYSDLLMNTDAVRGEYGQQLIRKTPAASDAATSDEPSASDEPADNSASSDESTADPATSVQPYHYNGSPEQ